MSIRIRAWALFMCCLCVIGFAQQKTEIQAKGETVTIIRDNYGVPHINASSIYGTFFGNGYAHAQDRLWQMEMNRRYARGQAAEVMGPSALKQDQEARSNGYTDDELLTQFNRLPMEAKEAIQGYVDGVNGWITAMGNNAPAKYAEMGISPRPWEVEDTIAIGVLMSRRFGSTFAGGGELRNLGLLAYLRTINKENAEVILNDLMWVQDPASPTTVPANEDRRKGRKADPRQTLESLKKHAATLPDVPLTTLLPAISLSSEESRMEFAQAHGLVTRLGSYALLVGKEKSASGTPILMGAPQMGFTVPHIAAELHLKGADIEVMGMGFPGTPGVLIGTSKKMAWTFTSGIHDLVDTYILKLNPNDPEQYWHNGKWVSFEKREEIYKVKGQDDARQEVRRSVYGPVSIIDKANNVAFTSRMAFWMQELEFFRAYLGIYRATSVEDFRNALRNIPVSFNAFCATQSGDIAFQFCGKAPIRPEGLDPRLPAWGTGEYDWKGFVPFDEMPAIVNPKQGFITNWNNKPATWWENVDSPIWGAIWHVSRISDLAKSKPLLTPEDVRDIAVDIASYDILAEYVNPIIVQTLKKNANTLSPDMQRALRYLEAWDHHGKEGSVPKEIFDAWVDAFRKRTLAAALGPLLDNTLIRPLASRQPSWIYYTLMGKNSNVPRLFDYMKGQSRDAVVLASMQEAIETLKKSKGDNMSAWRFSAPRISFRPLASVPYDDRGSYIQIITLTSPWVYGINVLPPGQSENPNSPHFSDQRDLASWWMFKPMLFPFERVPK